MCFQPSCQKAGKLQGKNFSCLSYLLDGVTRTIPHVVMPRKKLAVRLLERTSLIEHLAGCSEVVRSQHSIGLIWVLHIRTVALTSGSKSRRVCRMQPKQINWQRVMMCFQPSCQKAGKLQGKNFSCLSYLLDGVTRTIPHVVMPRKKLAVRLLERTSLIEHLAGCSEVVRSQHSIGLIWVLHIRTVALTSGSKSRRVCRMQPKQINWQRVMMCFQPSCQKAGKLQGKNFSCLSYLLDGVTRTIPHVVMPREKLAVRPNTYFLWQQSRAEPCVKCIKPIGFWPQNYVWQAEERSLSTQLQDWNLKHDTSLGDVTNPGYSICWALGCVKCFVPTCESAGCSHAECSDASRCADSCWQ